MAEEIKVAETEQAENEYLVKFKKPYRFEQKDYTEVDLSGLKDMTIKDAIDAQTELFLQSEAASSLICETTTAFAMAIAAKATGMPIEFFKMMPMDKGRDVKRIIQRHVRDGGKSKGTVLRLKNPHYYGGEVYEEFDLSHISDMTMLQESAAENMMAREGVIVTENSFNYLFACIIASMAMNKPKELFTSLPLHELLAMKDAVNNSDFFE